MVEHQRNNMRRLTWQVFQRIMESLTDKKHFLLAYSGGLDSQVLLSLLIQWAKHDSMIRVRAIHINHGLSPNANAWVSFCHDWAFKHNIVFLTEKIVIQQPFKQGLEAQARRLRYDAMKKHLLKEEVLLTAHHQNDQVETMLLQWLRGSGPAGLAAMPYIQTFYHTQLIRPLLCFPQKALHDFSIQHQLKWVTDESNDALRFKRNYVRRKILPPLLSSDDGCLNNLARTAKHCAEASALLQELADIDLTSIEHNQRYLNLNDLLTFNLSRQRNILRRWLALSSVSTPTSAQLSVLQEEVILAQQSANPLLRLGNIMIRRYQSGLYIIRPLSPLSSQNKWLWNVSTVFHLPQKLGTLSTKVITGTGGISPKKMKSTHVTIRFRQGGERMHPSKRNRSTSLKHLFQEWQIPPWYRDQWPLIFLNQQLIAVANIDVASNIATGTHETGFQILWQPMITTNGEI